VKPAIEVNQSTTPSEKKIPREIRGLKMERVRRVELPTLCLASMARGKSQMQTKYSWMDNYL
jgi:hypothetical protein